VPGQVYENPDHQEGTDSGSQPRQDGSSGEETSAPGTGARKSLSNAFNDYRPPRYDNSDSESEERSDASSGEEGSDASTAPSSVGSQTPATPTSPSEPAAPAPVTSQVTDTDTETRPDGGDHIPGKRQPGERSAFDDLSMKERTDLAGKMFDGTKEDWDKLKDPYKMWRHLGLARKKYDEDAKKATESGAETEVNVLPTLDRFAAIATLQRIVKYVRGTLASVGGATDREVNKYALSLLPEHLKNYTGSLKNMQWSDDWRKKLKATSNNQITGLLRGKEEEKLYEDWSVRNIIDTIQMPDGSKVTEAAARNHFRQQPRNGYATFKRSDPICSQLTNFRKYATTPGPPEFEQLNEKELERAKEMKVKADKTTEGGGTEADVQKAWNEAFGPHVDTGPRHVFFNNVEGTMTGTMGDGTVVTMTCGTPSPPAGEMTFDTSAANPFILNDPDGTIKKEWDDIVAASAIVRKELAAEEAAAEVAMRKAIAKKQARLKPLPPKDGVTDLLSASTKAASDTSTPKTLVSWNQYHPLEWQTSGSPLTEDNADQALDRLLTQAKIDHLLRKKFPALGTSHTHAM